MTTKKHTVANNLKQDTRIILDFVGQKSGRSVAAAPKAEIKVGHAVDFLWRSGSFSKLIEGRTISDSRRTEVPVFLLAVGLRMVSASRSHPRVLSTRPLRERFPTGLFAFF